MHERVNNLVNSNGDKEDDLCDEDDDVII